MSRLRKDPTNPDPVSDATAYLLTTAILALALGFTVWHLGRAMRKRPVKPIEGLEDSMDLQAQVHSLRTRVTRLEINARYKAAHSNDPE